MKSFIKSLNESKKTAFEVTDSINYISAEDLDTYLKVANKFISDEAKEVINWLKVNNKTYLHDLDPSMKADNALAAFYNAGVPKDEHFKELYKMLGKVIKAGNWMQIPVFLTKEQFEAIINKKCAVDEILIGDLWSCTDGSVYNIYTAKTHSGAPLTPQAQKNREKLTTKYMPIVYKIVNQYVGKANVPYEDLITAGLEGLVQAMNCYGLPHKRNETTGKWEEAEKIDRHTNYTFGQFAGMYIRNHILTEIKDSHLVRLPNSEQARQREEQGYNTKNNSISGDATIGRNTDGKGKTVFDTISDMTAGGSEDLNQADMDKLWSSIYEILEKEFDPKWLELFYRVYGLHGYEKADRMKQKDIAKEFGLAPNTANLRLKKIINFIKQNPTLNKLFGDIRDIKNECLQNKYREDDQLTETRKLNFKTIYNED